MPFFKNKPITVQTIPGPFGIRNTILTTGRGTTCPDAKGKKTFIKKKVAE